MKKKLFITILITSIFICAGPGAFGADSENYDVNAQIPDISQFSVTVSKVIGNTWIEVPYISFGPLAYDTLNRIFKPDDGRYFAVDVEVADNSMRGWGVNHTITPVQMVNGTQNLDSNINVTFAKVTNSSRVEDVLSKVSYALSNNVSYTKDPYLTGGWLRIYYAIATGINDAAGVIPISAQNSAGQYVGAITLTFFAP